MKQSLSAYVLDTIQDFMCKLGIYVLALQRSLIILVGLTMTLFSEKMLFPLDAYVVSRPTCTKNVSK